MKPQLSFPRLVLLASLFLSSALVLGASQKQTTFEQSFQILAGGVVEVDNPTGDLSFHTWDRDYVHLRAEKVSPPGQPVYFSDLSLAASESTIVIGCYPADAGARINLTVFVPRGVRVEMGSPAGSVQTPPPGPSYQPGVNGNPPPKASRQTAPGGSALPSPPGPSGRISGDRQRGNDQRRDGWGPLRRSGNNQSASEGSMGIGVRVIPPFPRDKSGTGWPDQGSTDGDPNSQATPPSRPGRGYPASPSPPGPSGRISGDRQRGNDQRRDGWGPLRRSGNNQSASEGSMGIGVRVIPPFPRDKSGTGSPDRRSADRDPFAVFDEDPFFTSDPDSARSAQPKDGDRSSLDGLMSDRDRSAYRRPAPGLRPGHAPTAGETRSSADAATTGSSERLGDALVLSGELVSLNTSVRDRSGRAINGLTRTDFQVYEDGVQQEVTFFSPASAPFNLVLMLDLSGSTREKLHVIKRAAQRFIDTLQGDDRVAVIAFTREIEVISPLTQDRTALRHRIENIRATSDGTALYEGLWRVMTEVLRGTHGQRNAIVALTDGVDNSISEFNFRPTLVSFEDLLYRIEETDLIVYPIYLDTEREVVYKYLSGSPESYALARERLQALAEMTGGVMFRAKKVEDLDHTYDQVASELRTVYSLGYYPTNGRRDGSWRRVRIKVKGRNAEVRTRAGYYAR